MNWLIGLFQGLKKGVTQDNLADSQLSPTRIVVFRWQISPQIESQNRKGLKGCVRGLWQTNLCKNIKKLILLPYPFYFKLTKTSKTFQTTFLFLLVGLLWVWRYQHLTENIFKGCSTFLYLFTFLFAFFSPSPSRSTTPDTLATCNHELFNFIDAKAKCHHLKNWPVKGLCSRCLSEFMFMFMLEFSTQLF